MTSRSPYRPGAGFMPRYLAGREKEIQRAEMVLDALVDQVPTKSVIYSGLRGVGKTVLLNHIESLADDREILYEHMEIEAKSDFISLITASSKSFLRKLSYKEKTKAAAEKVLDALKSLSLSFDPRDSSFQISMDERELYLSASLTQSLTDVLVSLGKVAQKQGQGICFFIDEIQFMKKEELASLISALHRTNQLSLPVMVIGAGLPKVYKLVGDAKSYAERLFDYYEIGSLPVEASSDAIRKPAEKQGIVYEDEAVEEIIAITKGYPFFIQQLCDQVWRTAPGGPISAKMVRDVKKEYYAELDNGFFQVRLERCTAREIAFLYAMLNTGKLPCPISDVAKQLKSAVTSVSPMRAQLINKGLIYAVRYSELDYTVPDFDVFLKRRNS